MSELQIQWVVRPTLLPPDSQERIEEEIERAQRHISEGACEGKCFGTRPVAVIVATLSGQISCYCDKCYDESRLAAVLFLPAPDAKHEDPKPWTPQRKPKAGSFTLRAATICLRAI